MRVEKVLPKTSASQREANRRYRQKMEDNEKYKRKHKESHQIYVNNNKEKYNEYQRDYQRSIYYPNKRQEELNNKVFEKETKIVFPVII